MKPKWLDRALVYSPVYYTLCTTDKLFQKELNRLKVKKHNRPVFLGPRAGASCTTLENKLEGGDTSLCCVVTICTKDHPWTEVAGMLAHEAVHIWRVIREALGESSPSEEFEAYAIQNISQNLMEEYVRQTK